MTGIPWAMLLIAGLILGLLWFGIRETRKGAVNQYKANEAESIAQTNRMLHEAQLEIDRLDALDKRKRLREQFKD